MRPDLVDILACPVCKGPLELTATETRDGDVVAGSLYCGKCRHSYPVAGGIPNLLPPEDAKPSA